MRSFVVVVFSTVALGGVTHAQSAAPRPGTGYVEAVAQSAFGNITSQSFGAEFGVTVLTSVQVFLDVGLVHNVATAEIGTAATTIASYLSQTQANVAYRIKQPVTFGLAGVKFNVPVTRQLQPYVMAGGGVAKV